MNTKTVIHVGARDEAEKSVAQQDATRNAYDAADRLRASKRDLDNPMTLERRGDYSKRHAEVAALHRKAAQIARSEQKTRTSLSGRIAEMHEEEADHHDRLSQAMAKPYAQMDKSLTPSAARVQIAALPSDAKVLFSIDGRVECASPGEASKSLLAADPEARVVIGDDAMKALEHVPHEDVPPLHKWSQYAGGTGAGKTRDGETRSGYSHQIGPMPAGRTYNIDPVAHNGKHVGYLARAWGGGYGGHSTINDEGDDGGMLHPHVFRTVHEAHRAIKTYHAKTPVTIWHPDEAAKSADWSHVGKDPAKLTVRQARSKLFEIGDQDATKVEYEHGGQKHSKTAREARAHLFDVKDQDGEHVTNLTIHGAHRPGSASSGHEATAEGGWGGHRGAEKSLCVGPRPDEASKGGSAYDPNAPLSPLDHYADSKRDAFSASYNANDLHRKAMDGSGTKKAALLAHADAIVKHHQAGLLRHELASTGGIPHSFTHSHSMGEHASAMRELMTERRGDSRVDG